MNFHYLLPLWPLLALASCGRYQEQPTVKSNRYIDSSTGTPIALTNANQCAYSEGEYNYQLSFLSLSTFPYSLSSPIADQAVSMLRRAEYGGNYQWKSQMKKSGGDYYYYSSKNVIKSGSDLVFCPSQSYSNFSYQAAGLKVLYALEEAHQSLSRFMPTISPIELKIAPIIHYTTIYDRGKERIHSKRVLVNNAMYSSSDKQILFLPQGKDNDGEVPFGGIPLWDIPLIAAHEYGHHIFSEIMRHKHVPAISSSGPCFDTRQSKTIVRDYGYGSRQVSKSNVVIALNEGAADLIAHYSLRPSLHNLSAIDCLAKNREVSKAKWTIETPKLFDAVSIDLFFSNQRLEIFSCMLQVDYQDEHILGANIANLFDQLFDLWQLDRSQRLKLTLEWLQKLSQININSLSAKKLLMQSVQTMVQILKKQRPESAAHICLKLNQRAPELVKHYPCRD